MHRICIKVQEKKEHDEVGTNNPPESMSNVVHRVSNILMDLNV